MGSGTGGVKNLLDEYTKLCSEYGHKSKSVFKIEFERMATLKKEIESKLRYGDQFLEQKYHYVSNFEAAAKVFNDLTPEEYEKYASAFSIMTWIANELADASR